MEPTPLEQAVFRTVAWFSLFSYPLTTFEVWKWLLLPDRPYDLAEVYRILDESPWLETKLQREKGFFALLGTQSISGQIKVRQDRFLDAVRKFASLRRAVTWFQLFPGVRAVAAVNTMAWWHTTRESDIDLYIITRPGMIWSSRLLLVTPFKLLGKRPHIDSGAENPFCFSFFNTVDNLGLESLKIKRDYYLSFWSKSLVPVLDKDKCFDTHVLENRWVNTTLPHAKPRAIHHHHKPRAFGSAPIQPKFIEPLARVVQRKKFPSNIREIANKDTRVVINDQMLKLYPIDRRETFRDEFEKILSRHL